MLTLLPQTRGAWIRFILSFGMLLLILYYLSLAITNRVAIESRVNAEILPQIAQIDGVLVGDVPLRGEVVRRGDVLATIRAERADDRTLVELTQSLAGVQARIQNLKSVVKNLSNERDSLIVRHQRQTDLMQQRLKAVGQELQASYRVAKEDLQQSIEALKRGSKLNQSDNIARSQYEILQHDYERARANVQRLDALIAQNAADQAGIVYGVTLSGNYADTPYAAQRIDEIQLKLITAAGELKDLEARAVELTGRRKAEASRMARMSEQTIISPIDGVVWRSQESKGHEVLRGGTILSVIDCGNVFIEATVYERFLAKIAVGQRAQVKMLGESDQMDAEVRTIMGSAINIHVNENVAVPMRKNPGEATVLLSFADGDHHLQQSMCGVGRTAEVLFEQGAVFETVKSWFSL